MINESKGKVQEGEQFLSVMSDERAQYTKTARDIRSTNQPKDITVDYAFIATVPL